jgi:hypothetical protein
MASRPKISDDQMKRLNRRLEKLGYRPERMSFDTKLAYILDAAAKVPADDRTVGASARDTHGW